MATEAKGQRVNINGKATDVLYKDATAREQLANIHEQLANIGKTVYPVGAIYISYTKYSPAELFGGTWQKVIGGFLYAEDDTHPAGTVGGEETHTLTVDEMPKHRHSSNSYQDGYPNSGLVGEGSFCTWVNNGKYDNNEPNYGEIGSVRTSWMGGSKPHNNMPPYRSVFMWRRIA